MKILFCRLAVIFMLTFGLARNASALSEDGFKSLHLFSTILHYAEENYVEKADEQEMLKGAINGMLRTLDPHSQYMSPEVYRELKVDTRGHFDGIGIEVTIRDGQLTVVSPIRGTPADQKGVHAGDQILKINGKNTSKMSLTEAVKEMRGKRGSKVRLFLKHKDEDKEYELTLVRQLIRVPNVKSELLDKNYGYFSIASFQQGTTKTLRKRIKKMMKRTKLEGIILDLRRNPGGLLGQAVRVSDLFLEKGIIVTTESRGLEVDRREASLIDTIADVPMIVLVDGGSASASEIVAGALKDHKRAIILGTRTFGKGSVQNIVELEDGGALKLTIAHYFTPSGNSIQAAGIDPDIIVPRNRPTTKRRVVRESDLAGHLEVKSSRKSESKTRLDDYQKQVALDYLKSWAVFRKQ